MENQLPTTDKQLLFNATKSYMAWYNTQQCSYSSPIFGTDDENDEVFIEGDWMEESIEAIEQISNTLGLDYSDFSEFIEVLIDDYDDILYDNDVEKLQTLINKIVDENAPLELTRELEVSKNMKVGTYQAKDIVLKMRDKSKGEDGMYFIFDLIVGDIIIDRLYSVNIDSGNFEPHENKHPIIEEVCDYLTSREVVFGL